MIKCTEFLRTPTAHGLKQDFKTLCCRITRDKNRRIKIKLKKWEWVEISQWKCDTGSWLKLKIKIDFKGRCSIRKGRFPKEILQQRKEYKW